MSDKDDELIPYKRRTKRSPKTAMQKARAEFDKITAELASKPTSLDTIDLVKRQAQLGDKLIELGKQGG